MQEETEAAYYKRMFEAARDNQMLYAKVINELLTERKQHAGPRDAFVMVFRESNEGFSQCDWGVGQIISSVEQRVQNWLEDQQDIKIISVQPNLAIADDLIVFSITVFGEGLLKEKGQQE